MKRISNASFEETAEFKTFTETMRRLVVVPKSELDERMRLHELEVKIKRGASKKRSSPGR